MPPKPKEKTANKSGISEHHKKKNVIKVSMQDRAICWCQGFRIGCGKLLGRTQRFAHKAKENAKMEKASSPAPPNEVQETLRLIEERQEAARIARNIQGSPDAPQIQLEEDGMEVQDFGDDGMLQDDAEMLYSDAPAPEVAELFHLEVEGLAEQEDVPEEPLEEEEEEREEPQFLWDQAESGEDSDDDVLRAAEEEKWEEIQRLLLECQDEGLSEDDLADIQGLAYNLKHSHSREALQDLATMLKLRSPYIMKKKLEHFSGLKEECYDCCIDSCMLFAGPFADLEACQICSEPRRDNRGKPRNVFRYLPIIPRLQSFFQSQKIIDMLRYRQELGPYEGTLRDVFDGEHFRELLGKTVSVDGVDYEHKIGDSEWDIFLGFTFDGVSLWRGLGSVKARASTTCWPVAVIVYSFDPILRTRQEHIFSLGVIPGPHSPKHVNSFLYPFFDECRKGAIGIPTFHRSLDRMFMMRFYTIFNTMDMPALAKANGSKNAGAIIPCHECPIEGIRDPAKKTVTTYYVPHQRPGDEESQTDDLLANLKTHTFYEAAWHELSEAESIAEYKKVQSTYGITCIPILGLLPSIDLVKSFPYGLMHLLFENNAPNMVLHWQGNYKKLDPQDDPYALDDATWVQIGLETAATIRTTPSTMTRATPDIWLYSSKFTAESWAFWITWLAPYLMEGRLPAVYYNHLLLFTDIIKAATSLEITEEMLDKLNVDVKLWHAQYENLYYRFEMDRISACPLTLHALIHLYNDTRHAGPLSRIWEYVTERFMGKIARSVTSRQYPFSQLAETVKKMEQVKMVAFKYGLEKELYFGKERRDWSKVTQQEKAYPEINDTTILKSPVDVDYEWPKAHQTQAAIYFKQALQLDASAHKIAKILSKKVVRWGKFRVKGEKNVVRSAWAAERVSADRLRDSSFVRVELLVDRNMDDPTLPDVPELVVLYGQLLYIAHVTLPKNKKLKIEQDCEALLGIVQFCKDARGDAALRPVWYTEMGVTQAVNISTIQCSVGRVKVAGTPSRWGILDVNYGCASTTFLEDEDNSGDASDDE